MWRMNDSERVFTDDEWEVFATGLDMLRSFVESDIGSGGTCCETGVPVFDTLTPEQKLAILADVSLALRDPSVQAPPHTAANEGTIAAVFDTFYDMLCSELDAAKDGLKATSIRRLILTAIGDDSDRDEKLPSPRRKNLKTWRFLLDELEGRVLWDEDFMLGDEIIDLPPEVSRGVLAGARIDPDYFNSVPRDPDEQGLTAARQTLARLLDLPVPDDRGLYPALYDQFHAIMVGPCSSDEADDFWDHPWIATVGLVEPDWDCDYPTWLADFRGAIPDEPFTAEGEAGDAPEGELPAGVRVKRQGEEWVVWSKEWGYWSGLIGNGWTDEPDEFDPALTFATEEEARSAYLRADRMYAERADRHAEALERLGIEEE